MKKYIIYSLIITLTCGLGACNNDEDVDKANSIFSTEEVERSPFDNWILGNYTHPYNIALKYRMEDNESDMTHVLAPADYKKSVVLAKIIKHVWLEAYDEATGNPNFLRQYIPKTIHFIGSPAYEDNGTMVLGTAEGGMKITLYNVNDINPDKIDINLLNEYYFQTMHHEFAHILHQTKNYDPAFDRITEDFVENIAVYVTNTEDYWNNMLQNAGESGRALIKQKFEIVYSYMEQTWGINLDELREIVLRRQDDIANGYVDLSIIE